MDIDRSRTIVCEPGVVRGKGLDIDGLPTKMPLEGVARALRDSVSGAALHAHAGRSPIEEVAVPNNLVQRRLPLSVEAAGAADEHAAGTSAYRGQHAAQSASDAAIEGLLHDCGQFDASAAEAGLDDKLVDDFHFVK